MSFEKWITIIISVFSLFVSGAALRISLNQSETDDFRLALETVSKFVMEGSNLPGTPNCFEFLVNADDRLIRNLFARDGFSNSLKNQNSDQFTECINQAKFSNVPSKDIPLSLRKLIIYKLNSYESALLPVYYNAGMHEPICSTIWPSFDEYADDFIRHVYNMNPRPYLFLSNTELRAVTHFATKGSCLPNLSRKLYQ